MGDHYNEDDPDDYLAMKDALAMRKKAGGGGARPIAAQAHKNPPPIPKGERAGGGSKGWSSPNRTQEAIQQRTTQLEALRNREPGPEEMARGQTVHRRVVPKALAANFGKEKEPEIASQNALGKKQVSHMLPRGVANGGAQEGQATKMPESTADTPQNSRIIFYNEMELESALLSKAENVDGTGRYKDPDFPTDATSLFVNIKKPPEGHIPAEAVQWLRPHEFLISPTLFVDGGGIIPGCLGNSWFTGALMTLSCRPDLIDVIIPSSDRGRQNGIYTIRFYKYGQWKNVVIDDRIPCDMDKIPLYSRTTNENEIWVMLIEKAYAKMHGCYQNLANGSVAYAFRDLTGGAPQTVDLREEAIQDQILNGYMWQQLKLWVKQGLMGCAQDDDDATDPKEYNGGFQRRRIYGVLDAREPEAGKRFLKLKNYYGKTEWTGKWGNNGPEWIEYPEIKALLNHDPETAGNEFWMLYEDWYKYFHVLHVCQLFPDSWQAPMTTHPERDPLVLEGVWSKERRLCGGSLRKGNSSWWANPQFRLRLTARTQVFVTLTQEDRRYKAKAGNYNGRGPFVKRAIDVSNYPAAIGLVVVRAKVLEGTRIGGQLRRTDIELLSRPFRRSRDVSISQPKTLDPKGDDFIIIPMVYDPKEVSEDLPFIITVAASRPVRVDPIPEHSLIEPKGIGTGYDSDEDSDYDFDEAQLLESAFKEHAVGGRVSKHGAPVHPKDKRSTSQIIATSLRMRQRFQDESFPPGAAMLFRDARQPTINIDDVVFLRPCWSLTGAKPNPQEHLVAANPPQDPPRLFRDGAWAGDIRQGELADCWFLGAAATLATKPDLLRSLFVQWDLEQGIFTVRVFKNGKWMLVTIDDRLPARKTTRTLLYSAGVDSDVGSSSLDPAGHRIMWLPLLEKAYAKAHGCYQNLSRGNVQYAIKDLTAGAPQVLNLEEDSVNSRVVNGTLWKQMQDWYKSGALMLVVFRSWSEAEETNLRPGCGYPIVDLKEVQDNGLHRMVLLRNPWTADYTFQGEWANESKIWSKYKILAAECPHKDPGLFWMEAGVNDVYEDSDFFKIFSKSSLIVTRIFPSTWAHTRIKVVSGVWLLNPQFQIHLQETRTLCFIDVGQADLRAKGVDEYKQPIGFALVRARTLLDKGANIGMQDILNPPPFMFKYGRDASLSFAVTLEKKDSPYVIIAFSRKGYTGSVYASVWHNKDVLLRGGETVFSANGAERDADDDEEEMQPQPADDDDMDPAEAHIVVQGRAAQQSHAAKRKEAEKEREKSQDETRASAGGQPGLKDASRGEREREREGGLLGREREREKGAGSKDERERFTAGGTGVGVGIDVLEKGPDPRDQSRKELTERILKRLEEAPLWQLQAVAKLLD